jgi:ArsR family transcriptional regulator
MGRLAGFFKALANPHRLRIFIKLVSCCPMGTECQISDDIKTCVGELGKDLGLAASTVSHHIKELHRSGLLKMERSGQHVNCWIEENTLRELSGFFANCCEGDFSAPMVYQIVDSKERAKA